MTTITIPTADDVQGTKLFDGMVIGTLNRERGGFDCLTCKPIEYQADPCKVYGINIRPYSQTCHSCGGLVVDGCKKADKSPLNLFEADSKMV